MSYTKEAHPTNKLKSRQEIASELGIDRKTLYRKLQKKKLLYQVGY